MANLQDDEIRYKLLKLIEINPNISQRELSKLMKISLGKVNYCLKAVIKSELVRVGDFSRSNQKIGYAYALTPKGISEKYSLTSRFLKSKKDQYDLLGDEIICLEKDLERLGRAKRV